MTLASVLDGQTSWWIEHCSVLDGLRSLPDGSVHCVVTSPPYWGLRSYGTEPQVWGGDPAHEHHFCQETPHKRTTGVATESVKQNSNAGAVAVERGPAGLLCSCGAWRGELGAEPTIELYVAHMVEVFRELKRVLHPTGTCWLNIGDSYAGSGKGPTGHNGIGDQETRQGFNGSRQLRPDRGLTAGKATVNMSLGGKPSPGTKAKGLRLIPERLAIALQDDGWWVRSRIAWCKTSAMPESVQDRPTSAWEHVWLLTRSARYFYDAEAVRQAAIHEGRVVKAYGPDARAHQVGDVVNDRRTATGFANHDTVVNGANLRNFWVLGPEPFAGAHFATFPPELARRCILAGSSERGVCPKCGGPWRRLFVKVVEEKRTHYPTGWMQGEGRHDVDVYRGNYLDQDGREEYHDIKLRRPNGWIRGCKCKENLEPIPSLVLDPFAGSGTAILVASRNGRRGLGLELNPEYIEMARRRIVSDAPLFNQ